MTTHECPGPVGDTQRITDLERELGEAKHNLRRSIAHANDLTAQVKRLTPDAKRWAAFRNDMLNDETPLLLALDELAPDGLPEGSLPDQVDALVDQAIAKVTQ